MSLVVESWHSAQLEDLLIHVIGGDWGKGADFVDDNFKTVSCIRGSEFKNWRNDLGSTAVTRRIKASSLETRRLSEGDLIIEISGGGPDQPVGRTALVTEQVLKRLHYPAVCTNFLRLARPSDHLNSSYLNYYLMKFYTSGEVVNYQGGSNNLRNLKFKKYVKIDIPVPSLAEQKAIAEKLDTLLAQVETIKARLERIPKILKRFRQSVLSAAVNGTLIKSFSHDEQSYYETIDAELSSDPKLKKIQGVSCEETALARNLFENPDWTRWRIYALEQLVEGGRGIPYGIVQTGEAEERGVPTVRCGDVKPLAVDTGNLKNVNSTIEEKYTKTRLKGGEVILAIRGTVGNAAVVNHDLASLSPNISREVAMIPVRKSVDPKFIALLLQSPGGYKCLAEKTRGVAQRGINLADVRRLVTPLPTLGEQAEIVRRVDQLFAYAERVEKQVSNAFERTSSLTQSILNKAFRGELTEQWRKDNLDLISGENSAEALLQRIQAEREQLTAQRPKRHKKPK